MKNIKLNNQEIKDLIYAIDNQDYLINDELELNFYSEKEGTRLSDSLLNIRTKINATDNQIKKW